MRIFYIVYKYISHKSKFSTSYLTVTFPVYAWVCLLSLFLEINELKNIHNYMIDGRKRENMHLRRIRQVHTLHTRQVNRIRTPLVRETLASRALTRPCVSRHVLEILSKMSGDRTLRGYCQHVWIFRHEKKRTCFFLSTKNNNKKYQRKRMNWGRLELRPFIGEEILSQINTHVFIHIRVSVELKKW